MAAQWHYTVGRTKFGPVSEEQLQAMLSEGRVRGDSLIWKDGLTSWVPFASVAEFARFAPTAPPRPPLPSARSSPPPVPTQPSIPRPVLSVQAPTTPRASIAPTQVSDKYQRIFDLIDKAGGPSLPRFRDLTFGERFKVNINWSARFGGPFWYLSKDMPKRALTQGLFLAFVPGLANISYYKKIRLNDNGWW